MILLIHTMLSIGLQAELVLSRAVSMWDTQINRQTDSRGCFVMTQSCPISPNNELDAFAGEQGVQWDGELDREYIKHRATKIAPK